MNALSAGMTAAVMMAGGWMWFGCAVESALMPPPVLLEQFEVPPIRDAVRPYAAGHSFTTESVTWNVAEGGVEIVTEQDDTAVFDGSQAVHLNGSPGAGTLTTRVATSPKQQYTLTFFYARHAKLGDDAGRMRVEVLGSMTVLEADVQHDSRAFDAYRRYSGRFTADREETMLRFTSLTQPFGIILDGIAIHPVPPLPPTPPRIQRPPAALSSRAAP